MNAESRPRSASEPRIYVLAAIATTALILIGFARTYYLKFLYGAPPLTPLVHLHGLVMSVWFGLFFVQVFLVSKRRVDLHRKLGTFVMLWAPVVFVVAVTSSIIAAKLGHAPPGPPPLVFLAVPLGDMFFFACVVPLAFVYRKQPAIHKRLMLLGFLGLMDAAIARIPLDAIMSAGPLAYFGLTTLLVVACAASRKETLSEMIARHEQWFGNPVPFNRTSGQTPTTGDQVSSALAPGEADKEEEDRRLFLEQCGSKMTGTIIHFVPDATFFETTVFDYDILAHRLRELAFLNAGLTIKITDERSGDKAVYCYAGGLVEFVKYLNEGVECLHPLPIDITKKDTENKLELEVAMQYTTAYDGKTLCICQFSQYP